MTLFIYPPTTIAGGATEATLLTISGNIADLETLSTAILNKLGASAFTLTFDQQVFTYDATRDYIQTKLAASDRQLMTITYADATKQQITDITVTTSA